LLSCDRLSKKPLLFKSFTGLTVQEFNDIYEKEISKRYKKYEIQRLSSFKRKDVRERRVGAGRPFKLDVKDRFLMLLVYYRLYITYTLAGFLFDLDQSNICRDIQKIEGLIKQCLPIPQKIYNKRKRTLFYSGKKKRHTVKTQLMTNNHGIIIYKSDHKNGRRHDYDIYKEHHPVTPKEVVNVFDLGYYGVEKDYPEQLSSLPNRKKRNQQELSQEEKEYNVVHSKRRIVIEHTICRLKKFRILSDVFRNRLRKYNKISDITSGLVNYRIMNHNY
jgi:hypothetical protein